MVVSDCGRLQRLETEIGDVDQIVNLASLHHGQLPLMNTSVRISGMLKLYTVAMDLALHYIQLQSRQFHL